jgi:hypothetical protein
LLVDELFERVVLPRESGCVIGGLLPRSVQLLFAIPQGQPSLHLFAECCRAACGVGFRCYRVLVLQRFVFRERLSNLGLLVASQTGQVFLRIVQFVLVQCELRLGQFQLIRGCRLRLRFFGQPRDARLVGGHARLQSRNSVRKLLQRPARWRCRSRGIPDRCRKRLVQLVIRQPRRLARKILLIARFREATHLPRSLQQPVVHHRSLITGRRLFGDAAYSHVARDISRDNAKHE